MTKSQKGKKLDNLPHEIECLYRTLGDLIMDFGLNRQHLCNPKYLKNKEHERNEDTAWRCLRDAANDLNNRDREKLESMTQIDAYDYFMTELKRRIKVHFNEKEDLEPSEKEYYKKLKKSLIDYYVKDGSKLDQKTSNLKQQITNKT